MYHRACGMGEKSVTIEDVYIYPLAQSINYSPTSFVYYGYGYG